MKKIKKAISVLFSTGLALSPLAAFAQQQAIPAGPQDINALLDIIDNVGDWVFTIFLTLAAFFIIYAAFKFLTASGDADAVSQARQMLVYALVGVAIAVLARGLVSIVQNLIT